MRATKIVFSVKLLPYKDRLKRLKLPTLKFQSDLSMFEMLGVPRPSILRNQQQGKQQEVNKCKVN